ncbi:MAG TPA: 2,3-bisphosphoglycerate-dependent phosphoglycerate mutase [Flavobacteriales bacterium]|jgi:2,3-bisphosphoglycerate-dependent phosphoglycerate mutase|nr:2,3-diphosphoglycerate-dependent phosphoglycerate mutase [Salibacteraceae bacterium]HAS35477.1 2,3-bisphosphoglycerate-dependent phosphoglycerate mutase [Flavobacteriales bacterium]
MAQLVIIRHGQSEWNLLNKFTGWVDVDLSPNGVVEAKAAAEKVKALHFDGAFSSVLKRANRTLDILLEGIGQSDLEVVKNEALNERMYGDLQGKDKNETREKYGEEQVHIWRRSYDIAPPNGESLKDTAERVIPYFDKEIAPLLKDGKTIIISAHGNSLRALIMHLEKLSPDEILEREIPTGAPILYELDSDLKVLNAKKL